MVNHCWDFDLDGQRTGLPACGRISRKRLTCSAPGVGRVPRRDVLVSRDGVSRKLKLGRRRLRKLELEMHRSTVSESCPCHPFADGGGAKRKSAIVVHRNARMQFNENEAAALFHLEHA